MSTYIKRQMWIVGPRIDMSQMRMRWTLSHRPRKAKWQGKASRAKAMAKDNQMEKERVANEGVCQIGSKKDSNGRQWERQGNRKSAARQVLELWVENVSTGATQCRNHIMMFVGSVEVEGEVMCGGM